MNGHFIGNVRLRVLSNLEISIKLTSTNNYGSVATLIKQKHTKYLMLAFNLCKIFKANLFKCGYKHYNKKNKTEWPFVNCFVRMLNNYYSKLCISTAKFTFRIFVHNPLTGKTTISSHKLFFPAYSGLRECMFVNSRLKSNAI